MTTLDVRSTLKALGLLAGNEMIARAIARNRRQMAARKPGAKATSWYRIRNADDEERAELFLYDEISWFGMTADQFARDLSGITAPNLTVRINSPGGDVFDGIAIMNALRAHPATVTTQVDGLAASIASVIVQGGDRRVMSPHSQMMIHEASGAMWGDASEMRAFADLLDKVSENIAGIYADAAGDGKGDADAFRALMLEETWLNDTEVLELGLADEIGNAPANADEDGDGEEDDPDEDPEADPDEDEEPPAEDADEDEGDDDESPEARARNRARWLQVLPNARRRAYQELLA